MKLQRMIGIQIMLMMGMGAGLLLARPVYAQQDVDPAFFDYAYNPTVMDQASNATPSAEAAKVAGEDSAAPLAAQGEEALELTSVDASAVVLLMIVIGSIALLGIREAVRGSRRRTWKERAPGGFPTGATAN